MKITATTEQGNTIRLALPAPTWEGSDNCGTGRTREAIYVSPKARRCVVKTYSIWDNGNGQCVGDRYALIEDTDTLNVLAGEYPEVAAALEQCGLVTAEEL